MKEHVESLISSFKDYKGIEHKMVLVAVSSELPKTYLELYPNDKEAKEDPSISDSKVYHIVNVYDEWNSDEIGEVVKVLRLGIAICNPEDSDKFSERAGIAKAVHRARNSKPVMYVSKNGYINSKMVRAFLEQEAIHIQNNPGCIIKGYDEAQDKFKYNEELKKGYSNLSEEDKNVVAMLADLDDKRLTELQKFVKVHNENK